MANEVTTTTVDDLSLAAELLASAIMPHFYGNLIAGAFVRSADIGGAPTKAKDFPITPGLTASSIAEGMDLTNTPFATSKVTLTVGEVGLMLTITDLLSMSDIVSDEYYSSEMGKAMALKFNTDVLALSAGFSGTCGATGVNLTEANILAGLVTLASDGIPPPYSGALHPQQWADLIADVGTTITPAGAGGQPARAATNDLSVPSTGGLGALYGVEWYTSHLVPTANAGADRAGMIVAPAHAIGHVSKWDVRVEPERDASLRAREIVVTACYAIGELRDAAGIGVITDA
ncbi:MAG TPA: hypothetical protein VMW52_00605 [Phycisphaerae bacterium]|nr:hypothetical protein [Phycisphaerae bacterium]